MNHRSLLYNRKPIAVIWKTVLVLPTQLTWTRALSPISDIHSRNADMAISRPMMTAAEMVNTIFGAMMGGGICTINTSAVATSPVHPV